MGLLSNFGMANRKHPQAYSQPSLSAHLIFREEEALTPGHTGEPFSVSELHGDSGGVTH